MKKITPEAKMAQEIRIGHTAGPGIPLRESGNSLEKYKAVTANKINIIAEIKWALRISIALKWMRLIRQ